MFSSNPAQMRTIRDPRQKLLGTLSSVEPDMKEINNVALLTSFYFNLDFFN